MPTKSFSTSFLIELYTVYRSHETVYNSIKKEVEKDFVGIKVLPNIFKRRPF